MSLDFMQVSCVSSKKGAGIVVKPEFTVDYTKDLMVDNRGFVRIWNEDEGLWCDNETVAIKLIDAELREYAETHKADFEVPPSVLYLRNSSNKQIDEFHHFCRDQLADNVKEMDQRIIFANTPVSKNDYATFRLPYDIRNGDHHTWSDLLETFYGEDGRDKIEWCVGAIVSGASRELQKFLVLMGEPGTGKSTILDIILDMFRGYAGSFKASDLGSRSASFALEMLKSNPVIAYDTDGDLSKLDDNTKLNSIVSHEPTVVNAKFKAQETKAITSFLMIASNSPVMITDSNSGIIRRLIDVHTTGKTYSYNDYKDMLHAVKYEYGAIAQHCLDVYLEDPDKYRFYRSTDAMRATNAFINFLIDHVDEFTLTDEVALSKAWSDWKTYKEEAQIRINMQRHEFQNELSHYFDSFNERGVNREGIPTRKIFKGFRREKVPGYEAELPKKKPKKSWLELSDQLSILDSELAGCSAQYTRDDSETPRMAWAKVTTTLSDICTTRLHYVKPPENLVVIDFDLKDASGEKSMDKNLKAAARFLPTYAETSKSGKGLHLHYWYDGDIEDLKPLIDENIEVKVFKGGSSLRRKLIFCNDIGIATLHLGDLPLKERRKAEKVEDYARFRSEKLLRKQILDAMDNKTGGGTKTACDWIDKLLKEAYEAEQFSYDLTDMLNAVYAFASHSSNNKQYCIKLVMQMKWKSKDIEKPVTEEVDERPIMIFDIESWSNFLLIVAKALGKDKPFTVLVNPSAEEVEALVMNARLGGYNNIHYDNKILHAAMNGLSVKEVNDVSRLLTSKNEEDKKVAQKLFWESKHLSYFDVMDYTASKKSLKSWECELGITHIENEHPWDEPLPEEFWDEAIEYCKNDVLATEQVFMATQDQWEARKMLAKISGLTPNDKTNDHTCRIIFGKETAPQGEFIYRSLATPVKEMDTDAYEFLKEKFPEMMESRHGEAQSLLPYFPGYSFELGKTYYDGYEVEKIPDGANPENVSTTKTQSMYMGIDPSEGGYVYSVPGIHYNVVTLDVESMHPHSLMAECHFGAKYTRRFNDIVKARVAVKHQDWDALETMLDGVLAEEAREFKQMTDPKEIKKKAGIISDSLKIAINSVYGLTSARFKTKCKDPRNVDNIVAKRGALFMIGLQKELEKRGTKLIHVKTDSIKLEDPTLEDIQFCLAYGKRYGYTFVHETTYERMCLINKADFVAWYANPDECKARYGYIPSKQHDGGWTVTGAVFAKPGYAWKQLFTHEDIDITDLLELKTVSGDAKMYLKNDTDEIFVGKAGNFLPVKTGGLDLVRVAGDKESFVAGTKGYHWMIYDPDHKVDMKDIDYAYYEEKKEKMIAEIAVYGDPYEFLTT